VSAEAPGEDSVPIQALKRRLLSGGAWAFGGKVLIALTGLASSALLARLLSPGELGLYFLAYSVVVFCTILGTLGLGQTVVRLVAENMSLSLLGRVRSVIGVVLSLGALGSVVVGLAYWLYGGELASSIFDAPALAAVSGLVMGWIVVGTIQGILGEIFRGFHDIRLATILGGHTSGTITGVSTVSLLAGSLFVLWLIQGQATLATVMLLAICSGAVSTLASGWMLGRKVAALPPPCEDEGGKRNHKEALVQTLSISWPLLIIAIVMFARTNVDVWVLGIFRSSADVALYGAANRLVAMVTMPLIVVNAVVPPLIAEMYHQGRGEELERILRSVATLGGIPASLTAASCIFLAAPIMGLVYGDYYRDGAMVLALLSVGLFASVCAGSCGITMTMTGHQKTMMVIAVTTGVATFAGMIAAVEPYGIVGVATVRMVGQILQNALMLILTKWRTGMWTHMGLRGSLDLLRMAR
jgi:O-antigen/teichoic acid export membrane protein